jgi:cytochrome bd-type quinol oxidase subunit 2
MKNPWDVLRGQERSWIVFWLYCVLGVTVVTWLFIVLAVTSDGRLPDSGLDALAAIYYVCLIWAHAALWTCAFNTKRRAWGYATRAYAFALLTVIAASIVFPYFVRSDVPPEFEVLRVQ